MTSVTFPTNLGGDGSTVSDDSNPSTGLANGGHRTRFVPALANVVAMAQTSVDEAQAAADSAAIALNAPGTSATSTTSMALGTGSKSFTLAQTGKAFALGQSVIIASTASPANWMAGAITAFNSGTGAITVNALVANGSSTFADWTISLTAPIPSGTWPITAQSVADDAVTADKIAAGAVGSSEIADGAVATSKLATGEQMTTANVLNATAAASAGAVGTYAFAYAATLGVSYAFGSTIAGSSLRPVSLVNYEEADTSKRFSFSATALSGTWRCLGFVPNAGGGIITTSATLWLRIS